MKKCEICDNELEEDNTGNICLDCDTELNILIKT